MAKPYFKIPVYLVFFISFLFSCNEEAQNPPNVLFILVDDLGYADLGFSGSPFHETPNIDQLASQSFQFTHGYSGSRVCSPARATIMTGQFTASHGITDWIGAKTGTDWRSHQRHDPMLPADYQHQLSAEATSLAEAFKQNGYRTFFAGKWHLGDEGSYPEDHGFDANVAGWDKGSPAGGFFSPYNNPKITDGPDGENLTIRLANEVADFMNSSKEEPFFAFLSFYAVHAPVQTSKERWEKYRDKAESMGIQETGFEMGEKLPYRTVQDNPNYAGLVASVDDAVGIVLERLRTLGLEENTIVVFTSDNGGVVAGDAFATTNLFVKGGKGHHWEGGIRVPYLIKVPGKTKGQSLDFPVVGADFYPTLLDLIGGKVDPTQTIEGMSLKPLLEGESSPERPIFWHYPHYGNQGGVPSAMVRLGDWKLIRYFEDGQEKLYNIPQDPFEEEEVSEQNPRIHSRLSDLLTNYLKEKAVSLPVPDPEFDQKLYNERLQEMEQVLMPRLEKQRLEFLSKDWQPNPDWWGSMPQD
ncbi:sulfatase [Cyclobacterium jeungdonense]|uniref:Sulfatase n=1 Tax=Cyclobacterium jeungdonense TaxID=708087 RepID=A0ABT8CAH0_9BACT|nr:sulfatase [Cyclobacterium jeungdonense]MDN3689799.1 sulfatase [Cyclobacterium jeungdonense]